MSARTLATRTACALLLCCAACDSSATSQGAGSAPTGSSPASLPVSSPSGAPPAPGSVVVYQGGGIWTVPRAGRGSPTSLSGDVSGPEHPDWSPDGRTVVFESEHADFYTAPVDGSQPPSLLWECATPCTVAQDAAWSPDGSEIAFMTAESTDGVTTSRAAVLALDVGTGATRTVVEDTSGTVWLYGPRWSGDGRSIVLEQDTFASHRLDEGTVTRFEVVVVPTAGGGRPRPVASWPGPAVGPGAPAPDWSRDRDLLVYSRADNLHVVRPDGTGDRTVTQYDGRTEHAIQPTFAPGGDTIVFTHVMGEFDVDDRPTGAVIGLDGDDLQALAGGAGMTHPRLNP